MRILKRKLVELILCVHRYPVFLEQRRADTVSGNELTGKRAVVDGPAAAGGRMGLQYREVDASL